MNTGVDSELADLSNWTWNSGVQQQDGDDKGAVWAWLDSASGAPSFLYTEITGYYITHVCNLAASQCDNKWHERAVAAADWICASAGTEAGLLLTRKFPSGNHAQDKYSFSKGLAVFFDNCMAAYGLLRIGRDTGRDIYIDAARRIANASRVSFFDAEGCLASPVFDTRSHSRLSGSDHWSSHAGAFNLKCGIFYQELAALFPDEGYDEIVDELLANAMRYRAKDGRFLTSPDAGETHLHPLNYTIEGLLGLADLRQNEELLDAAIAAVDFVFLNVFDPAEKLRHVYPAAASYCGAELRTDTVAQTLRSYHIARLQRPAWGAHWESAAEHLHGVLSAMALSDGSGAGTSYGLDSAGTLIPHANSWCHFFRTEAVMLRELTDHGAFQRSGGFHIT